MAKTNVTNSASDFPTVGESVVQHVCNLSGKSSKYTMVTPKKTMGRGASPIGATGGVKSHSMIHEAHGPAFTVKATLYKANAAEASMTMRNVRVVPTVVGNRDSGFWAKRAYGQKLQ